MASPKAQILVFYPDAMAANQLCDTLNKTGYQVSVALDDRDALALSQQKLFNLILIGIEALTPDTAVFMNKVRLHSSDTQFILISQRGNVRAAIDAIHQGAFDYLLKPVKPEQLTESVGKALSHQTATAQDTQLRQRLVPRPEPNIFAGGNPAMREIHRLIDEIAPTDVTVVIQGESGTGKEVIARAIHEKSRRENGPFIAVNCAALADSLIESEFFGHVKGAFTGAINDRLGRFQLAQGGTLFLDEIGDLSVKGQGDLLRVIEDGIFRPIGSPKLVRANARIIAAANKDLEKLSADGRFRDDLLYRLNIVSIHIPPLRERAEDIPSLVDSFARFFCAKHERRSKKFSPQALAVFRSLPWPGNVRQLRNLVERLVVTTPHASIEPNDLPTSLVQATSTKPHFTIKSGMTLAQVEAELIRQTLLEGASQVEAAARLGISRRALQYKVKQYALLRRRKSGGAAKSLS
jgi:DNA-binding NtrC family response regulator